VPPNDTYDASVRADLALRDPSRAPRRAARRAQLVEAQAQVAPALFDVRQQVTRTFFAVAALDARRAIVTASLTDLEARRAEAARRVRAGAALPSEAGALAVELLRRRQELEQVDADRAAAVATLADWTGAPLAPDLPLALPDDRVLTARVESARAAGASLTDTLQARPELALLAARRARLAAQATVAGAARRPRLGAFARAGYGRPGLNMLADEFQGYWLAGVQLQWAPVDWGRSDREREALRVAQALVGTEEAAFRAALARATRRPVTTIDRLTRALVVDDSIVALREALLREATARHREGVLTAAEYVNRQTDLLAARLAQAAHRVELVEARVEYLTILGLETRP
jgi:outer membrane protein TolC